MKTDTSSTKRELGKFIVDLAINRIHDWADSEFNTLRHTSTFPICVPLSPTSWYIANYQLDHISQNNWKISRDDETIHVFYSKHAAVFYVLYTKMMWYKNADRLLALDQATAKLNDEMQYYSNRLTKSKNSTDGFKLQLWYTKYLEAKSKYQVAKSELETALITAKAKFAKNLTTDK